MKPELCICDLTSEVVPRRNTELFAVVGVVLDTILHGSGVSAVALDSAVDSPDRGPKPLVHDGVHVGHPEPESGLERDEHIVAYCLRGVQPVEPDGCSCWSVVVVPCELQGSTTKVMLVRGAWVLGLALVAVVVGSTVYLVDVAEICG